MAKGKFSARIWQDWFSTNRFEKFTGQELVIGIDCGKTAFYGAVMSDTWDKFDIIYFESKDIRRFIKALKKLPFKSITLITEPTGTYGDTLVNTARGAGFKVIRIQGAHVRKLSSVYDNMPSLHDGKSAYILARMYLTGHGEAWKESTEEALDLYAIARLDALFTESIMPFYGNLESLLARHWPEITSHLKLTKLSFLKLISTYGSPQNVAENAEEAAALIRSTGKGFLKQDKINALIESAKNTLGIPCTLQETILLKSIAGMALDIKTRHKAVRKQITTIAETDERIQPLVKLCGPLTAFLFVGHLGSPLEYEHPKAYEKSLGINLCENTTGKSQYDKQLEQRGLRISKRGPKRVRALLYLMAMRHISPVSTSYCPVAQAWYQERRNRNGNNGMKALIALMRKLVSVLWWLARGAVYDPEKLFDIPHLKRLGHLQDYKSSPA